jgi:hypothetical protein
MRLIFASLLATLLCTMVPAFAVDLDNNGISGDE